MSEVKQEPQFKAYGADSVKFTINEVDSQEKRIKVSINCDELTTNPDDIWIDAHQLDTTTPLRMANTFVAGTVRKVEESDVSTQLSNANSIKNQEQTVTATELEVHKELCIKHKQIILIHC